VRPVICEEDIRRLAADVLRTDREYPIVCLTARPGQIRHLSVLRVRSIVGPGVPIYVIASAGLVRQLREYVPALLCPEPGLGRVWRPGVDDDSTLNEHPRIYDPEVRGEEAYARLRSEFETSGSLDRSVDHQPVPSGQEAIAGDGE
jgi:hypothetical protein